MAKLFVDQAVEYSDPCIFKTPGQYSMAAAVAVLSQLEDRHDCEVENSGWELPPYGNLVEIGVGVQQGNIEFTIMCSYDQIQVQRISGNKSKFYGLCEIIRSMDINE
jgi:hypothetical protein